MKTEQEYIKDLSEIRSMMERSSKFLSLTGWSGIMAGIYALIGSYVAYRLIYVDRGNMVENLLRKWDESDTLYPVLLVGFLVLLLAVGTAIFLSHKKAERNNEALWNKAGKRLVYNMGIPLCTGGILALVLVYQGFYGLIAPVTLLFYGLSLINASTFTFRELKYMGITEIILGLLSAYFLEYGLVFWAVGFGVMHIAYGIYMHLKYEK